MDLDTETFFHLHVLKIYEAMNTIGIDISKEWVDCLCSARRLAGQFPNTPKGWKQLSEWIEGDPLVVLEASGPYYLGLATYLYEQGIKVSVLNPLVIRRYGQMKLTRIKTDAKDAGLIAQYGIDQQPELWCPPSTARQGLKKLMSMREGLLRQKAILTGQAEAFNQNKNIEPMVNALNGKMQKEIEEHIARIDRRMETLAEKHYQQVMEALLTIPGIGKKTAIELVAVTDGFRRFDSARKLASYVGICPRIWESGSSVKGRGSISKLGYPQLRKLLYMCSWSAKRSNPACKKMYQRLKSRGKPEKVIKVAIAHKLLRQAYAVGSKCDPFTEKKALAA
jgi:transposase